MKVDFEETLVSRRALCKMALTAGAAVAAAGLAACSSGSSSSSGAASSAAASSASATSSASAAASAASASAASASASSASSAALKAKRNLIVYFSRAGENYGVGVVEEGNTAVVAHMIAGKVVSDSFEIVPVEAYPDGYDECCDVAKEEQGRKARPALATNLDNLADYDMIYLGYPIWWGDLPMVVYTFLEGQDWTGKTIAPFSTHAGSGLSGTVEKIQSVCKGATVTEGLSITGETAQNDRTSAESAVNAWLAKVR